MPLPTRVNMRRLTGRWVNMNGDPWSGQQVTIRATPAILVVGADDLNVTTENRTYTLDSQGRLFTVGTPGHIGVDLIATNDPDVNPIGWTYTLTESFGAARSFSFFLPVGGTGDPAVDAPIDVTDIAPAPSSPGTGIVVGPPGPPGPGADLATVGALVEQYLIDNPPTGSGDVPSSRRIVNGTAITGGGDFTADRTISVVLGTTASTAAYGNHLHDTRYVRTVNNVGPDTAGNVTVAGSGGGTTDAGGLVTGILNVERQSPQMMMKVRQNSDNSWPARPTTRTDIIVVWAGRTDPGVLAVPAVDDYEQIL